METVCKKMKDSLKLSDLHAVCVYTRCACLVCVCVHVMVCASVCACGVCVRVCMHLHHWCMYLCACAHACVCHVSACVCMCVQPCVCVCVCVHQCVCVDVGFYIFLETSCQHMSHSMWLVCSSLNITYNVASFQDCWQKRQAYSTHCIHVVYSCSSH